jgi:hypothetical protein
LVAGPVGREPELTLHELFAELGERGVVVSCDALKRQGNSFKKTVFATDQIALTSLAAAPSGSGTNLKSLVSSS